MLSCTAPCRAVQCAVLRCAEHILPCHDSLGGLLSAEGTFRPERIRAIAARFNLDTEAVLDNVSTSKVTYLLSL